LIVSASPAPSRRDPDEVLAKESDTDLVADLRMRGGMPPDVMEDAEMLTMTLTTLRADYRVCASYRHVESTPLPCPIHVFAGTADEIEADRVLAWKSETSAEFSIQWFEGGHFFVRHQEAAALAALVKCMSDPRREEAHVSAILA
jgi:surfactin synthase thioesterase subunit